MISNLGSRVQQIRIDWLRNFRILELERSRLTYDTAKRILTVVERRFQEFKFPLFKNTDIIPRDPSTLFICSGMQPFKNDFILADGSHYGSIQSCVRTNDLDLVGDGSHLTYFEMIGNFSFGANDYQSSIELWDSIIRDLQIPITYVTVHPDSKLHQELWKRKNYNVVEDSSCTWSDGNVGGYCCEMFVGQLEIGNLVNPMGHSTDVGFGLERLLQIMEGKSRVDQTELFRQDVHPIVADHYRTLKSFRMNGIKSGVNGREFICRKILRKILKHPNDYQKLAEFKDWLDYEKHLLDTKYSNAKRFWKRNRLKPDEFWKNSYGLSDEEVIRLRQEMGVIP